MADVEFEYIRHGTLCLMANFDVVTGRLISPSIGPTRTEDAFVAHIEKTIDTYSEAAWIFVVTRHPSAVLRVRSRDRDRLRDRRPRACTWTLTVPVRRADRDFGEHY